MRHHEIMASTTQRKRPVDEPARPRGARPAKKQRRQRAYHSSSSSSDSEDDHGAAAPPDRLFGSDDGNGDLEHAEVDDGASSVSHSPAPAPAPPASACDAGARRPAKAATSQAPRKASKSLADDSDDDADGSGEAGAEGIRSGPAARSKRNDAAAFATSIAKLLTTSKLTTRQRADPIVARSAGSRVAAQRAVDAALEARARRRLRQEKRAKAEKGRVRDVVVGVAAGEVEERGEAGGGVGERERRLRKVSLACVLLVPMKMRVC